MCTWLSVNALDVLIRVVDLELDKLLDVLVGCMYCD